MTHTRLEVSASEMEIYVSYPDVADNENKVTDHSRMISTGHVTASFLEVLRAMPVRCPLHVSSDPPGT